jgi:hypothetical protein
MCESTERGRVKSFNMEADTRSFGSIVGQMLLLEVHLRGEAKMSTIFCHKFQKSWPMVISTLLLRGWVLSSA